MAVTSDIVASYRAPGRVMRRQLAQGPREDRALVVLMLGCGLMFVAQWPRLSREAALNPDIPREALFGAALMGWVFIMPLVLYLLAPLTHLAARMLGGRGTWFGARFALFWAVLATSPVWLLQGLVAGFLGAGVASGLVSTIAIGIFAVLWFAGLREAERSPDVETGP